MSKRLGRDALKAGIQPLPVRSGTTREGGCDERKPAISNAFLVFLQYYSSALPTLVCYHSGAPLWYNKGVMTEVDQ